MCKTKIENLMVYKTILYTCNSDGEPIEGTERPVWVLYNKTQISEEEIEELFENDGWDCDSRLVEISPAQLKFLQDKVEENEVD